MKQVILQHFAGEHVNIEYDHYHNMNFV